MKRKLPTLAEVAKTVGVSQMTVSRALNNRPGVSREVQEDVLRVASELGYFVNRTAQKLSGGRSRIIGLITTELHDPFVNELVAGVGRAARTMGYELLVYSLLDPEQQPPSAVLQLMQQIVDGVVVLLPYSDEYLSALSRADVPLVTVESTEEDVCFPTIAGDNLTGGRLAVEHLIELGHRRIAFISGDERLVSARERRRAYRETLAIHGLHDIAEDSSLIAPGDFTYHSGHEAVRSLLERRVEMTAIFAANDMIAMGAIAALRDAGLRVPEDVSVIGFDDIYLAAQSHPPLTTISQPKDRMGRAAVNSLLARISGLEAVAPRVVLPTELVVRRSTAPLSAR